MDRSSCVRLLEEHLRSELEELRHRLLESSRLVSKRRMGSQEEVRELEQDGGGNEDV